jgi:hypothetical protein
VGGTSAGDHHSFVQVVKSRVAPVVMVPPRPARGWERDGFGAGRGGRGGGRVGHRGFAWYRVDWGRGQSNLGQAAPVGRVENQGGGRAHTDDQASGVQGTGQMRATASDPAGAAQGTPEVTPNLADKADLGKDKVCVGDVQAKEKQGELLVGDKVVEEGESSAGNNWEKADQTANQGKGVQVQSKKHEELVCFRCNEPGHYAYKCSLRWPNNRRNFQNQDPYGGGNLALYELIAPLCATQVPG